MSEKKKDEAGADVIIAPNGLSVLEATDGLVVLAVEEIVLSTISSREQLAEKLQQYKGLTLETIEDLVGYDSVKAGITDLEKTNVEIEAKRKSLTDPAFKYQKDVKAGADAIIAEVKPVIAHLKAQKLIFDDKKKAAENARFAARTKKLVEMGYQLVGGFYVCGVIQAEAGSLHGIKDEDFDFYVREGQKELDRIAAADAAMNSQKQALKDQQDAMDVARAALDKEREELAAQRAALELAYGKIVPDGTVEPTPEVAPDPEPPAEVEQTAPEVWPVPPIGGVEPLSATSRAVGSMMDAMGDTTSAFVAPDPVVSPATISGARPGYTVAPPPDISAEAATSPGPDPSFAYKEGMRVGFHRFRHELVTLLEDPNFKGTRTTLLEWANRQELRQQ